MSDPISECDDHPVHCETAATKTQTTTGKLDITMCRTMSFLWQNAICNALFTRQIVSDLRQEMYSFRWLRTNY